MVEITRKEMITSGGYYVPDEGPNHKMFLGKVPKLGCQICKSRNVRLTGLDREYTKGESPMSFISWECLEDDCGFIWGEYFKYIAWATNDKNQQITEE